MNVLKKLISSRKFWLSMIPVAALISKELGIDISEETMVQLITTISVLVAGIAASDVAERLRD